MEKWKSVPDFPDYEVSSIGRVRRLTTKGKRVYPKPHLLKQKITKSGYPGVGIYRNGAQYEFRTHQLVAMAFIGPRPTGMCINHINFIRTDNRVENLEYVTFRENTLHTVNHRRHCFGESRWSAKLTDKKVKQIKRLLKSGCTISCIAYRFSISRKVIHDIANFKIWKHIH